MRVRELIRRLEGLSPEANVRLRISTCVKLQPGIDDLCMTADVSSVRDAGASEATLWGEAYSTQLQREPVSRAELLVRAFTGPTAQAADDSAVGLALTAAPPAFTDLLSARSSL